ncbi:MAG: glycosyltransferase [Christensenellales bacterium]|jgi:1,2-diacylglycerol 3-alpha-glucosyltransferase
MRILHCCLSCYYVDNYGYQENYLPICHQNDGHDVLIIASTETFIDGKLDYKEPAIYKTETGIPIIRLPYCKLLPHSISKRVRHYPGLLRHITAFMPDVILFHGSCALDIVVVSHYVKYHPGVKMYVDSHEALYNSAKGFISKNILHKCFYRFFYWIARKHIEKTFYVGASERDYMISIMGETEDRLEFFPLGGFPISHEEKIAKRTTVWENHGYNRESILFVHSGKFDNDKKTLELLRAFSEVKDERFQLIIIGKPSTEILEEFSVLVARDNRINYLGWKLPEDLQIYLAAAHFYLQPGSVSATLQQAICAGTAVLIYPHESYDVYVKENGVKVKDYEGIKSFFSSVSLNEYNIEEMSKASFYYAQNILDYRILAQRVYH